MIGLGIGSRKGPSKMIFVVFVGLPVVDHMDDGIGCFERACEKKSGRRKFLLKAVEFR